MRTDTTGKAAAAYPVHCRKMQFTLAFLLLLLASLPLSTFSFPCAACLLGTSGECKQEIGTVCVALAGTTCPASFAKCEAPSTTSTTASLLCSPGEFKNSTNETVIELCEPCPAGTYMDESLHQLTACKDASEPCQAGFRHVQTVSLFLLLSSFFFLLFSSFSLLPLHFLSTPNFPARSLLA